MKKLLFCLGLLATPTLAQPAVEDGAESFSDVALASSLASSLASTDADADARGIVCTAVGGFGFRMQRFHGFGFNRWMASRRALRNCRSGSFAPRTCRIRFCRPSGGHFRDDIDDRRGGERRGEERRGDERNGGDQ